MVYFGHPGKSAIEDNAGFPCGFRQARPGSRNRSSMNSRRQLLITGIFLAGLLMLSGIAHAQSASAWSKRGQEAEAREDYDAAFEAYRQARLLKPNDLRYKTHFERVRFLAANAHVDRGRVLRQSGDVNGALVEFQRALAIDGGNQAAQQEIAITQTQIDSAPNSLDREADVSPKPTTIAASPIELAPVSSDPITLHMVEDSKVIYQGIGKAAGLNVIFDPDYTSRRIQVDLNAVSLADALRIVGVLSGTFWRPITSNTIFVAQNTNTKRQALDPVAVQTFYLSNVAQQNDATEILTALRNVTDPAQAKMFLIPAQNAIVMRAPPDQLALAQELLNNLDRTRPEVVVDVAVLEVNKEKVRNLGITLPQSFTVSAQSSTASSSSSSSSSSSTSTSNLTLNDLANFNATNYAVTIGTAAANALLTDNDTRILQNPKIRATDGQQAKLKIGQRIPVATGTYNSGVSTGLANIGVQTSFQYLDIGVNIDMTPTVHQDREVTLKMSIEVSSHNGDVTISGVTEPIIGQRTISQTIQLKEGEPSILAGILTKQETNGLSGTPGLSEIPLLKYFFSTHSQDHQQDEIVFLLIPHIVREPILTRMNTRAIDTGTSQNIELRRELAPAPAPKPVEAKPLPVSAASAATSMIGAMGKNAADAATAAQKAGANNPIEQQAAASASAAPVNFTVVPPNGNQSIGGTFQMAVLASNAQDLYSVPLQVQFNPAVLQLVNVDSGEFLGRDGQAVAVVHRDEGNGNVTVSVSRPPATRGMNGQGSVAVLTFRAIAAGDSDVSLVKVAAKNSMQANLPAAGSKAVVHVK